MILKGSQRAGPRQLAAHLLNKSDNDHVVVHEIRGFMADDLHGAMVETIAIAKGTRCKQPIFSLSLNPPKDADASIDNLMEAVDQAGLALGLQDQPRAVVIHEKNGRRHAHVVWSRISPEEMKAINLPFFKTRLKEVSKELYLQHGWELPDGHKTNGWKSPLNFTLAEFQQAKRLDLDPREIKGVFQEAWKCSDNLASFKNALEEHGYYLAKGDRRGIVATDLNGEVYSVARWTGLKTKEVEQKLGKGDSLRGVGEVQAAVSKRVSRKFRSFIVEDRLAKRREIQALKAPLHKLVEKQRAERDTLLKKQSERQRNEGTERAGRFRRGLGILLDVVTGRLLAMRKQNEKEAFAGYLRDRVQRERLYDQQVTERAPLHKRIEARQSQHRAERHHLARRLSLVLDVMRRQGGRERDKDQSLEFSLELGRGPR